MCTRILDIILPIYFLLVNGFARNISTKLNKKINVYFSEKLCYTIFSMRRVGSPGQQNTTEILTQAFFAGTAVQGRESNRRLPALLRPFLADFERSFDFFWQKN